MIGTGHQRNEKVEVTTTGSGIGCRGYLNEGKGLQVVANEENEKVEATQREDLKGMS